MKSFFKNLYDNVIVLVALAIVIGSFYSGMYFVSSQYQDKEPHAVMKAAVTHALRSTEDQPIIMIVPEYSFIEQAKHLVGLQDEMERDVITITTTQATDILIPAPEEPGFVSRATAATGKAFTAAGEKINDGAAWVRDGAKKGWTTWSEKVTVVD